MAVDKVKIKRHKDWQRYANKELDKRKAPIKFKDYTEEPVYYGKFSKPTAESQLKAAGIDWNKDKPTARLTRKK